MKGNEWKDGGGDGRRFRSRFWRARRNVENVSEQWIEVLGWFFINCMVYWAHPKNFRKVFLQRVETEAVKRFQGYRYDKASEENFRWHKFR